MIDTGKWKLSRMIVNTDITSTRYRLWAVRLAVENLLNVMDELQLPDDVLADVLADLRGEYDRREAEWQAAVEASGEDR